MRTLFLSLAFASVFLLLFGIVCGQAPTTKSAKIDSLEKVVAAAGDDTLKARGLNQLCNELRKKGEHDNALKIGEECVKLSQQLADKKGEAMCLNNVGNVYYVQKIPEKAMTYYHKSLKIMEEIGDKRGIANALNNIGNGYNDQSDFGQALVHYQKSLKLKEELGDKLGCATSLNNIGSVYATQGGQDDYEKALVFFQKSLKLREEIGGKYEIAKSLNNIAMIYGHQRHHEKALEHYQKCLKIGEEIGDKEGVASALGNIGIIHYGLGDDEKALEHYRKSLKIMEETGNKFGLGLYWGHVSVTMLQSKRPKEARLYAEKGLKSATEIGDLITMQHNALALSKADSALRDYQSAYEHLKLYHVYSDSLKNDDKTKQIAKLETKYEFEKAAEAQKRRDAAEFAETERVHNLQYLSIGALVASLLVGLFMLGKLNLPARVVDVMIFASFLIFFEFSLILFDPILDPYTGGAPAYKLAFNTLLAVIIAPVHGRLETLIRKRLQKNEARAAVAAVSKE